MSHKIYRICLLTVLVAAIAGGIYYYMNYVQKETDITEGTMVQYECCGKTGVKAQVQPEAVHE